MLLSLRDYLLPRLGELREPSRLSDQGRAVRELLLAEPDDDARRLRALRVLLLQARTLEADALRWLEVLLRGLPASGERPIEVPALLLATFWGDLAACWPGLPRLRAHQADELLLAGEREAALDAYLQAFEAEPALIFPVPGDVFDAFAQVGGEREVRLRLARIRAFVAEGDDEGARDEAEGLLARDAGLRERVEAALRG